MNIRPPGWIVLLLLACWHPAALKAQLKLGANPASISKSSILELESSRQGLLLPRVPDTAVTTLAAAPDGTIIYFTPASSILVRKGGAWRQMTDASTHGWLLNGNTLTGTATLGTVNNFALPFITNNQERMRIGSSGAVGIGITDPGNPLVVKDTLEIRQTNTASQLSQILFTNVSGTGAGDFRIGSDGQDIFWQGGGGRSLQMGSFWGMVLGGDRQSSSFPVFVNGSGGTGVLVQSERNASVPLAIQAHSSSQSGNLTEWRNQSGSLLSAVSSSGSLGIGSATFDATNPEKVLIDAGVTTSVNALYMKGSIDKYFQLNIRNLSGGTQSSSDIVATANNGTESTNFVNVGINGSGYVYQTGNPIETGKANDCYLLGSGNDLYMVNNNATKDIIFLAGGTAPANEAMRILSSRRVGIGTGAPSTQLHIKTGVANDGGLRMENLTSSSTITTGSTVGALGMDATGKVVRAQRPVIYSGGAGANGAAGGTATADAVTKVWVANVANTVTGTQTINFPTNVTFTNILSIQAIAVGGTGTADAPVVSITSNTLSSMVIRVLESSTVVVANEALTLHTNTGTRIYIRVEGN
jgi:hypothetical protein